MSSLTQVQNPADFSDITKEVAPLSRKIGKLSQAMGINSELKKARVELKKQTLPIQKTPQGTYYTHKKDSTAEFACLIDKVKGDRFDEEIFYIVSPEIQELIVDNLRFIAINLSKDENGVYRLDISKLPSNNGYTNSYIETKAELDIAANNGWVKYKTNTRHGLYEVSGSDITKQLPTEWPNFDEQLEKAFEGRIIESLDHPLLKKLNITVPCDSLKATDDY